MVWVFRKINRLRENRESVSTASQEQEVEPVEGAVERLEPA
jgi:hypothetical protein